MNQKTIAFHPSKGYPDEGGADEMAKTQETQGEFVIKPVGFIRSEIKDPSLVARNNGIELRGNFDQTREQAKEARDLISEPVIDPCLDGILNGIEDFSHVLVLYWPHLVPSEARRLTKVHPIGRKDLPQVGVFSTAARRDPTRSWSRPFACWSEESAC